MLTERTTDSRQKLAERIAIGGVLFLITSLAAASYVSLAPIVPIATSTAGGENDSLPAITQQRQLAPLLSKIAGTRLIRPAQVQAAVKDTGAAQRLLAKLNLQGVVNMGDSLVAYIQVDRKSVKTLHKGEKILEFVVEEIEPGRVKLSLDGVIVELAH